MSAYRPIKLCFISSALLLTACASAGETVRMDQLATQPAKQEAKSVATREDERVVDQISQEEIGRSRLEAAQIKTSTDLDRLTVDQLIAYNDRCRPDSPLAPPRGLDCSEIKLRMERRLSSQDDEVRDALITLDKLGRNETRSRLTDLKNGDANDFESLAIAGGLANPVTPEPPPEEEENVDELLGANGLEQVIGTIIQSNPQ